jgi:hypothetical protein
MGTLGIAHLLLRRGAYLGGQQRIRAIWEYHGGKYGLPKKSDAIDGMEAQGLKYEDLPDDLRLRFDTYNINVVIISDTDEDEVREMFLRPTSPSDRSH